MKKAYTAPKVIVHGTVEEITQMGILPLGPCNNPGKGKPPFCNSGS